MMWSTGVVLAATMACVLGHGRLLLPGSRSSAWRAGYPTPINYDDDGLNCGGFDNQHTANGGKCGICGDPYDAPAPRDHELGGRYGLGLIVDEYTTGSLLEATVEITAYHKGYWELKICPDPENNEQECFDDYVLELLDGGTKYYPPRSDKYTVTYLLPPGLVCEHCVLQWNYVAGNNWGVCNNGTQGLGCGRQETFWACADIAIAADLEDNFISVESIAPEVLLEPSPLLSYLKNGYFDTKQGIAEVNNAVEVDVVDEYSD